MVTKDKNVETWMTVGAPENPTAGAPAKWAKPSGEARAERQTSRHFWGENPLVFEGCIPVVGMIGVMKSEEEV